MMRQKACYTVFLGLSVYLGQSNEVFSQEQATNPVEQSKIHAGILPDDINVTVGLRSYFNRTSGTATIPIATSSGRAVTAQEINGTDYEITYIPTVGVRYKDAFVSASYFTNTTYQSEAFTVIPPALTFVSLPFSRREWDANLGYYVLPTLGLSLGYKSAKVTLGNGDFKLNGPTIGVSGTAPLARSVNLYGNFAYGRLKGELVDSFGTDLLAGAKFTYFNAEVGLGYGLDVKQLGRWIKSVNLTAGYRFQSARKGSLTVTEVAVIGGVPTVQGTVNRSINDVSQGFTLGVIASF